MIRKILSLIFFILIAFSIVQCGRRGRISGGPKDETPPLLIKTQPENGSVNFTGKTIKLFFDEYIKLQDVQNQLIISPPLKYTPDITPQGGASKFIEITIKDTLRENTTYTFNFGQSVQDNNEGNPSNFLTYVFSTGAYIDSLEVLGVVKDAFNKETDDFISVMLYELDSMYTDSTIFKKPPNYITNTLDSTVFFNLKNIKEGNYALFALKDVAKNYFFDQNTDKIAFLKDTVSLPTDSTYLLTLFKEIPNYSASVPSFKAKNRIIFGYYGGEEDLKITPLTKLPDTVVTRILKEPKKDTLNFWFTPFETDSMIFEVVNERRKVIDTFTVKSRKVELDSMQLNASSSRFLDLNKPFYISNNTPLTEIDTSKMKIMNQDSVFIDFKVKLDSIENKADFDFEITPEASYKFELLPGAVTDLFGQTNDTITYNLATKKLDEYGNLTINLQGDFEYPVLVQLTNEQGEEKLELYCTEPEPHVFNTIEPETYILRVVHDANKNGKWDTGNYLKKQQAEKVSYFPNEIKLRANWEEIVSFTIQK